jgi:hypothetical protein
MEIGIRRYGEGSGGRERRNLWRNHGRLVSISNQRIGGQKKGTQRGQENDDPT